MFTTMLHRLALSLFLVAALAACSSKSDTSTSTAQGQQAGDYTIATQFAPDPPKQGPTTLTVSVKDASGNPVKGATVKIVSKMPSMSMDGPTLNATDNGDGTYAAQTNLNYATQWTFDVAVSANGKSGTAHVTEDVK
jgi:nitrogen fixation protein FixH